MVEYIRNYIAPDITVRRMPRTAYRILRSVLLKLLNANAAGIII